MRLDGVISQAAGGLDTILRQLSVVSQNVSNANTPGYVRETLAPISVAASGQEMGVRAGVAVRSTDPALQAGLFAAGGQVASQQTRQDALDAIDAASGTPGSDQNLPSLVGALRDAFSTLQADPASPTQQRAVVAAASALAQGLNGLGAAVSSERQSAQDTLQDDIAQANDALGNLGKLTTAIVSAKNQGQSTADLEDQQDTAIGTVVKLTGAQVLRQADGNVLVISGGTALPTGKTPGPIALAAADLAPGTPVSAIPVLTVLGQPASIKGGQIGAKLALRDTELPAIQTNLDNLAQSLTGGFAAAGLDLFTDASGTVPSTPGFAQTIQVNPVVQANPSQVRDGAAPSGLAGDTTIIDSVLGGVLATGSGTVADQASELVASNAAAAAGAARQVSIATAAQTSLSSKLSLQTSVSVDSELAHMVTLQNSYAANARVLNAVQQIWQELLDSVR